MPCKWVRNKKASEETLRDARVYAVSSSVALLPPAQRRIVGGISSYPFVAVSEHDNS